MRASVAFEISLLLPAVRIGVAWFPFGAVRHWLDWYARVFRGTVTGRTSGTVPAVAWAVGGIGRRLPGSTTCLARALAAHAVLTRRGIPAQLKIGVLRPPAQGERPIRAHAWVEAGGRVVIGNLPDLHQYTELAHVRRDPAVPAWLPRLLLRQPVSWTENTMPAARVLALLEEQDLMGLVHQRAAQGLADAWPPDLLAQLTVQARGDAATELLRTDEVRRVLDAMQAAGVQPILLKGTALAHSAYEQPAHRPRGDTDLLIRPDDRDAVRTVLTGLGYTAPNHSDGDLLFGQFHFARLDQWGVQHSLDVHWNISSQAVFAGLLSYDLLLATAVPIPALGSNARGAASAEALLLACVHPAMHHRNEERLIWVYDIHLLARAMKDTDWTRFGKMAVDGQVAAVCLDALERARTLFGTPTPDLVRHALEQGATRAEPSAQYLRPGRRWRHDLATNLRALPRWRERARLLREVALPRPTYMLRAYGLPENVLAAVLLPALYAHRGIRGAWRALRGAK